MQKKIILIFALIGLTLAGTCTDCIDGTSGDCVSASLICFPKGSDGSCPSGTVACSSPSPPPPPSNSFEIGSYILLTDPSTAQEKLNSLAGASNLPFNKLYIAFVRPDMVYTKNSLESTGLQVTSDSDYGFAALKSFVSTMKSKNIDVVLSLGGWDWSCNPFWYMQYSIYQYGPSPNYWKIQQYGGGSPSGCTEENMFCYVCEPESEPRVINDFAIFPQPTAASQQKVKSKQSSAKFPVLTPGTTTTDAKTGRSVPIPGNANYITQGTNPYEDFVQLANDLGFTGVDLDYEEIWYGDAYGTGNGPYTNDQVMYKFGGILYDLDAAIQSINSSLEFSMAVTAQGADDGNWWGGNLKGQVIKTLNFFPDLASIFTGGVQVMTYDLSSNPKYHECPGDLSANCPLDKQVNFYMNQFSKMSQIDCKVGYEIGQPAYPDITNDPSHQLPLSTTAFSGIQSNTQTKFKTGGFIWETYKPTTSLGNISPTDVLNGICQTLGGDGCNGTIPSANLEKQFLA